MLGRSVAGDASEPRGALVVNADDWGRDVETTDRTLECVRRGSVSSVSAMLFMADSERAAVLARTDGVDTGLHLNLTTPFSGACSSCLRQNQAVLARFLRHPAARMVYAPWLTCAFEYVVKSQWEEFVRLYGAEPDRVDGHHHMHLAANVLFRGLLPAGIIVRRHFAYEASEKRFRNGIFRAVTDIVLRRRHRTAEFLFSLRPMEPGRLERVRSLADRHVVEVETHPSDPAEYAALTDCEMLRRWREQIAVGYACAPGRRPILADRVIAMPEGNRRE
jgi:predicted glycoside hydrolase/deacetylase ChbG (UPF0249 family)